MARDSGIFLFGERIVGGDYVKCDAAFILGITIELDPKARINSKKQHSVIGGMLPLMRIFYKWMGMGKICSEIKKRGRFRYDFESIMSMLCFRRILCPDSKLSTLQSGRSFIEPAKASIEDVYLALGVMARESNYIQNEIYHNTQAVEKRNTGVVYYDSSNYYFEIEKDDKDRIGRDGSVRLGLRKYGHSKENRPNPIVQCGLFMDADGMPLAFCVNPGNTPETQTIIPLEENLANDFDLSDFVCCTDGGLGAKDVRKYNKTEGRHYITVQSIKDKKCEAQIQQWALEDSNWHIPGLDGTYTIAEAAAELGETRFPETRLYKDRWFILSDGTEEHIIVTYSQKYADYQKATRNEQVARAIKKIERGQSTTPKSPNDCRRFITTIHTAPGGELAEKSISVIDQEKVDKESRFDGFYALATSLDDDALSILKASSFRNEIEALFRVTKTDLSLRPIYLQRSERILGHFIVCFIALLMIKSLQKEIARQSGSQISVENIISELRTLNYTFREGIGYVPKFDPSPLKDIFNAITGQVLDAEVIPNKTMRHTLRKLSEG